MTEPSLRIVLAGADGQLGRCLRACVPAGISVQAYGRPLLDITDLGAVRRVIGEERPDWIINAAAYTSVDKAEDERELAFAVNAEGVGNLAFAASEFGARLLTISSDFVFDGRSGLPYAADALPNPLSVYGASKLAGEQAAGANALIVRTAWVHASTGHNFVKTMLRRLAEHSEVRVVADQVGSPTSADHLAAALWRLVRLGASGIHHFTNSGVASWYDFAVAIAEEGLAAGLLNSPADLVPVPTVEFPTAATRPACAVLDKRPTFDLLGRAAPHWRDGLRRTLSELANG